MILPSRTVTIIVPRKPLGLLRQLNQGRLLQIDGGGVERAAIHKRRMTIVPET